MVTLPETLYFTVALRKESVDRNLCVVSLNYKEVLVALRKESVDRNYIIKITEIWGAAVALRKESVDRNEWIKAHYPGCRCRSPQGERG